MPTAIAHLLTALNIHPVLVDIGASGQAPAIWKPIARHSIYVGFDPDLREIRELPPGTFYKGFVLNRAVTSDPEHSHATFYLTRSPFCSSTLCPDQRALSNYLFADLFTVERKVTVPATRWDDIVSRLALPEIDWLKVDSQGTDLRLFNALQSELRSRVLALDVEPGLIDAYLGEDLFVEAHRELTRNGFWLSNLKVEGAIRMSQATLAMLTADKRNLTRAQIEKSIKPSPGWVEARYLRTIEWARAHNYSKEAYVLLWVFAMLDNQFGFALDLAAEWERMFGANEWAPTLKTEPIAHIKRSRRYVSARVRSLVPLRLKRWLAPFISPD
jgi:hypothetical protein